MGKGKGQKERARKGIGRGREGKGRKRERGREESEGERRGRLKFIPPPNQIPGYAPAEYCKKLVVFPVVQIVQEIVGWLVS